MRLRDPLVPGSRLQALVALTVLSALNLSDALTTLYVLNNGLGTELNPLADYVYRMGALPFLAWKIGVAAVVSWMAWGHWWNRRTRVMVAVVTILYGALAIYQYLSLAFIWSTT